MAVSTIERWSGTSWSLATGAPSPALGDWHLLFLFACSNSSFSRASPPKKGLNLSPNSSIYSLSSSRLCAFSGSLQDWNFHKFNKIWGFPHFCYFIWVPIYNLSSEKIVFPTIAAAAIWAMIFPIRFVALPYVCTEKFRHSFFILNF